MKPDYFTAPGLWIERKRNREGHPITYTVWRPNTSRSFVDTKQALKFISWPRGTPTGDALREWFNSFKDKDATAQSADLDTERIKAEGFGPEAHEQEPNEQTKMIT